ncbi:hypothetical protein [Hansschlegelia zhihuaiae]|uniref:Uncharacterized protein n=1 Tax=Hansschlegelia zhihuaiae TaxID=405005 RepID=A0A4Q0M6X0_9HYPH|nr:hypothetical protein [Hansschlegelia zhihuaiae]RXF68745.1 hypothetical protein EK403_19480 [Hansschlegelia zhihuaiae]
MSNDDVNAVVLRLALTLQRCGENPDVVFAALIGAAATVASDIGLKDDSPEELARAMASIVSHGDLRGVRQTARPAGAAIIPFRPARVA